jgi:uncharacterized cupredoxin-like copper-binding protein
MLKLTIGIATLALAAVLSIPALAAPAQTVTVTEREFKIALSAKPKAGKVTFVVKNAGHAGHDFWLRGGGKTIKSRVLGNGKSARLTTTLRKGVKYQYWCAVGGHKAAGMKGSFVAR